MRKHYFGLFLSALTLLGILSGCGRESAPPETLPPETTEVTVAPTVPADGDPGDVTCKGSYTAEEYAADAVVAAIGDAQLTNEELQAWYWLEVAAYQQEGHEISPDFSAGLDTQPCEIDDSVRSWQQYFLKRALNTWHSVHALEQQARVQELPTEEAYQPNLDNYAKYLTGMPATEYLYGYRPLYQPNSMHEAYLNALPKTLDALAQQKGYADLADLAASAAGTSADALAEMAHMVNYSYMYFTTLGYYVECTGDEVLAYLEEHAGDYTDTGKYVDIRHILLIPDGEATFETVTVAEDGTVTCSELAWEACAAEAEELLEYWQTKTLHTDATFAALANKNSDDTGSALNGGAYRSIRQGQLMDALDEWCFDDARQPGDTTILRSDYGCHILYFTGSTDIAYAEAEADLIAEKQAQLIRTARENHPAEIDYSAIALTRAEGTLSTTEVLYPDIAHERFPEVPLYLQQDYPSTMYGGFKITTNGCGITSFAMLASYMADDELTPPEMCNLYGRYSHRNGTDGMIFVNEAPVLGFYLRETTYEPTVARAALEEGQIVISLQHKGYWTRGGHYIVLEDIDENGMVQVRDSNIYNYSRVKAHAEDRHTWGSITNNGSGFWIYEDKVTYIPACSRCGNQDGITASPLEEDYICEKCSPALLRRNTYLSTCTEEVF